MLQIKKRVRTIPAAHIQDSVLWIAWLGTRGFVGLASIESGQYRSEITMDTSEAELTSASRWAIRLFSVTDMGEAQQLVIDCPAGGLNVIKKVIQSTATGKELLRGIVFKDEIIEL